MSDPIAKYFGTSIKLTVSTDQDSRSWTVRIGDPLLMIVQGSNNPGVIKEMLGLLFDTVVTEVMRPGTVPAGENEPLEISA